MGMSRTRKPLSTALGIVAGLMVLMVVGCALAGCGSSSAGASVPRCKPHARQCRETQDGAWVSDVWFYYLMQLQGQAVPSYVATVPAAQGVPTSAGIPPDEEEPGQVPGEEEEPAQEEEPPQQAPEDDDPAEQAPAEEPAEAPEG